MCSVVTVNKPALVQVPPRHSLNLFPVGRQGTCSGPLDTTAVAVGLFAWQQTYVSYAGNEPDPNSIEINEKTPTDCNQT